MKNLFLQFKHKYGNHILVEILFVLIMLPIYVVFAPLYYLYSHFSYIRRIKQLRKRAFEEKFKNLT